ncbi:MAG: TonB-dependent receptor [Planctomycetes bacterium]|nr:TonB-dependent receptor [Planctomycetota bacterium]
MSLTGYVNDCHFCPVNRSTDYRYQQLALQFNHIFNPTDNHSLSWGVDSRTDLIDGTNADPYVMHEEFVSTAIIGAYVQDEWRFAPRWTLNLGARIDYDCYGGFQPSARAALSYELTDGSFLYGAVSRAFQMPPAGLRFTHFQLLNGLAQTDGRPDTKAETLLAYEVGYRRTFFDQLETTLTTYWHDLDELTGLRPRLGPPGLIAFEYDNHASAASYGVEADARYAVTRRFMLQAHYTYEQLAWSGRASYSNKDVITPPKHKFMVGARYDVLEDLHLSSHLYYVDTVTAPDSRLPLLTRQIDPYFRLDLRAEYEFWKKRASIAIGVRNLLDRAHQEGETVFLTNAEVPRMVYAEMRVTFK